MLGKTARCGHSAVVVAFMLTMSTPAFAQQRVAPPQVGPENGSLVIVGGALRSPEIYQRFLELAGGPDAHIVMIPTAGGAEEYDQYELPVLDEAFDRIPDREDSTHKSARALSAMLTYSVPRGSIGSRFERVVEVPSDRPVRPAGRTVGKAFKGASPGGISGISTVA